MPPALHTLESQIVLSLTRQMLFMDLPWIRPRDKRNIEVTWNRMTFREPQLNNHTQYINEVIVIN